MAQRVSRRKIAVYLADKIVDGKKIDDVIKEAAAFLIDTRRTREAALLVKDVEDALSAKGIVVADVVSARPLDESVRKKIAKLIGAKKVQFREEVDESVLGGVRVDVPGFRFDGTVRKKLIALKAKQL